MLRVFGTNTEIFIDRTRELEARRPASRPSDPFLTCCARAQVLLQLNAAGFGAPVVATFANGRCESFLEARPLEPAELADASLSPRIARLLRRFHAAPVDGPRDAPLWPLLRKWLDMATTLRLDDRARQAKLEAVRFASFCVAHALRAALRLCCLLPYVLFCANGAQLDAGSLRGEVAACEAACCALRSPVVYCHNDLLAPNVLLSTISSGAGAGELHFIDFEYGCYNYRGFDLGNHFNEWAGFDCDYRRYPDDAQQRAFLAAYAAGEGGAPPDPAPASPEVDALVVEANVFSLASHLYWGIWALIQAKRVPRTACRCMRLANADCCTHLLSCFVRLS